MLAIFGMFFANFRPLTGNKTSPNYFFLVEEVLSFDLVGHIWKSVKNWLQKCILYLGEFFCIFWNCLLATSLSNVKNVTSQHVDVTYTTQYFCNIQCYMYFEGFCSVPFCACHGKLLLVRICPMRRYPQGIQQLVSTHQSPAQSPPNSSMRSSMGGGVFLASIYLKSLSLPWEVPILEVGGVFLASLYQGSLSPPWEVPMLGVGWGYSLPKIPYSV